MHSSNLRGTDFNIVKNGEPITHADYFKHLTNRHRLGVVAPNGIEGVGAVALIMAHVTAFYDTYRAKGDDFFAYPNYYSFQSIRPLASYTMLDIWPVHKDVWVENNPVDLLNVINDRAINILLLPDNGATDPSYEQPQIESALRTIETCYLYSAAGEVRDANLTIEVSSQPMIKWAQTIFDRHDYSPNPAFAEQKAEWAAQHGNKASLKQSYRRISADEALTRL